MKRVLIALLAVVVAATMLACTKKEDRGDNVKNIAILTPYLSSTTTKQMADTLERGMIAKGWKPATVDTKNNFAELASRMEDVITSKVDAIVIISVDPGQIAAQIKQADDAGIPVFGCDSGFIEGITVNATSNNMQMSEIITEYIFSEMGNKGNLVILTHRPHPGILKRNEKLEEMLKAHPDIKVVIEQHVGVPNPIENARTAMENILLGNADIDAVWAAWDEAAIGAVQAINDAKRTGIIVTGIDGNAQAIDLINQDSALKATVQQNFTGMADIVVDELDRYFKGETLERGDKYAPATLYKK